jgi:phage shock protein E
MKTLKEVFAAELSEIGADFIEKGAVIIDVRSEEEFDSGAIEGAILIPYTEILARIDEIGKLASPSDPIVVYCRAGRRAGKAKLDLEKIGYTQVINGGGYNDLYDELCERSDKKGATHVSLLLTL